MKHHPALHSEMLFFLSWKLPLFHLLWFQWPCVSALHCLCSAKNVEKLLSKNENLPLCLHWVLPAVNMHWSNYIPSLKLPLSQTSQEEVPLCWDASKLFLCLQRMKLIHAPPGSLLCSFSRPLSPLHSLTCSNRCSAYCLCLCEGNGFHTDQRQTIFSVKKTKH